MFICDNNNFRGTVSLETLLISINTPCSCCWKALSSRCDAVCKCFRWVKKYDWVKKNMCIYINPSLCRIHFQYIRYQFLFVLWRWKQRFINKYVIILLIFPSRVFQFKDSLLSRNKFNEISLGWGSPGKGIIYFTFIFSRSVAKHVTNGKVSFLK